MLRGVQCDVRRNQGGSDVGWCPAERGCVLGGGEGACSGAWLESLVTSIQALQAHSVKSCRACYKGLSVSLYHLQGFDSTG